jgi:hypothetical protein
VANNSGCIMPAIIEAAAKPKSAATGSHLKAARDTQLCDGHSGNRVAEAIVSALSPRKISIQPAGAAADPNSDIAFTAVSRF